MKKSYIVIKESHIVIMHKLLNLKYKMPIQYYTYIDYGVIDKNCFALFKKCIAVYYRIRVETLSYIFLRVQLFSP